ncbi:GlsB/YeaQ/YmgE family stress response membrane protein [soil metagenome]
MYFTNMNLITWLLFGMIAGIVGYSFAPTKNEQNLPLLLLLGIGGSLVGGVLANMIFGIGITGFNFVSFLLAAYGALVLLLVGKTIIKI